jgi:NADPH-dependent glutamate synthase beta subunit-like oxidoreductase/glutamate synthase domain-containing protein 3/NAD-dependent dihydropyrimidine dehydrogenase PreA subunit
MNARQYVTISGKDKGIRLDSRILEERIQKALKEGQRYLEIEAFGQHGLGGRLWRAGDKALHIRICGHPGQRVGSMGFANTRIEVLGPGSDDIGWLNAGAEIVVHGNAANGTGNAMAQGTISIAGNIGARGMTMTKANPRFAPPELWVLGSVGDYFGEFMAGGIAVVCGVDPSDHDNVLGYRPLVGMVGGRVFFRGPHKGYSRTDAKMVPIDDNTWKWLRQGLEAFLQRIKRQELLDELSDRDQWQLLTARTPQEKAGRPMRSMASFRQEVWDRELGAGGLIGDLSQLDRSPIALITSGDLRRFVPVWENRKYLAPCEATCPTGIPVRERWQLIRDGRVDEAVNIALAYTPFPATVCGYLCPNPCMQACTRQSVFMAPVDVTKLGQASVAASLPELPPLSDHKIAVIGGGAAGISVAWQLRQQGHQAVVYDMAESLGGKITSVIPDSRIPAEVVETELERLREVIPHIHLQQKLGREDIDELRSDYDFIIVAVGAQKPRTLPVPGNERLITAHDFLSRAKKDGLKPGNQVVIIGAGNVGCDVATEADRLGAETITLIDIQQPASFGVEREHAEAVGAQFRWPCFTKAIVAEGVELTSGEIIPADTVVISIGDSPDIEFLPDEIGIENGFIKVNDIFQTTDPKIFAIGDAVKPGLLTDAIGAGRQAAQAIVDILAGKRPVGDTRQMIDRERISLAYFDPRVTVFEDMDHCGSQCSSCGACRDCGICVAACPRTAISRKEADNGEWEYVVDDQLCIGCGFCAGACPCGIWDIVENTPLT